MNLSIKSKDINIKADKTSLEKLFLTLLDNAIKYTPKNGKVEILVEKNKSHVEIKIKDTGIGIPKKDLPYIFNRFYRADQSRSKNTPGFGLGLSLAKKIVELHKGKIEVKSQVNKGTTVIVRLPLKS